ncbi:hypothetical protein L211DRAFT_642485 [Terfezia boudieri ATCC MYA-4762]|uniref:Uncharacterized protein n=1 Tax=Terfezia boudieri ATCC MYA-4762 TaxID=1051890 RepID=A0A3N4LEU9_9PEZI|nr:hypothetical protein L211DRAFT_642485 [Terfezia boudieri ATCC MYA-4762]
MLFYYNPLPIMSIMSTLKLTTTACTILLLLLTTLPFTTSTSLDLDAVTSLPFTASLHLDLNSISIIEPSCCDSSLPTQSKGKVYDLLTKHPNITGSSVFPPFLPFNLKNTTTAHLRPWTWNFAAVQLNNTVANGDPNAPYTQFASICWLSAPGLWDDAQEGGEAESGSLDKNKTESNNKTAEPIPSPPSWDTEIELCALHMSFLTPVLSEEIQRLGYNAVLPPIGNPTINTTTHTTTTISPYGNCDLAFTHPSCASTLQSQVRTLYTSSGCSGLKNLTLDPECAPYANTLVSRPFLITPGQAGELDFQKQFFNPSAGRPEGVMLGKGDVVDAANIDRVWGSVVNEVTPLVLVGKRKSGRAPVGPEEVNVGMACVKGMDIAEGSRKVAIGGKTEGGDGTGGAAGERAGSTAKIGLVIAMAGAVVLGMV